MGHADAFALIADSARSLEWLEHAALDRGFINYPLLSRHDPLLASVRDEPRFKALMERVRERWEAFDA